MANVDIPLGFQPRRHMYGGQVRANSYPLASAYASDIFTGDAVVLTSGKLAVATAASTKILGIFGGCQYTEGNGDVKFSSYWPASTATLGSVDAVGYVYDDPGIIYRVQTDTGTAFVLATHNLSLCDLIATHAGSTRTGLSGQEVLVGTAGDEQFQVLQLIDEPGNAVGVNAKVEVKIHDSTVGTLNP